MGYDGSIKIDTKINTQGINKGTKSISASLKGVLSSVMAVAKTMAAVFIGGSIINGIRSLIGQFDIMGSSIGASVKQLSTSFDALKGAFVNLLLTALAPLIPYVISFVQWLTQLFNIVTQIIGALFGVKAGFGGVASAAGGAGKATKKSAKEAQGALAAFDSINVLQTGKDEQPDAGGGSAGGGLSVPAVDPISPEMLAKLEEFKAKAGEFFRPLTDALGRLYESLKPLGATIWEGLKWAWENILVPLGEWTITTLLPEFLDLLGGAAELLNEILLALQPVWDWFWTNVLQPLAEWTGGIIIDFIGKLTEGLGWLSEKIRENQEVAGILLTVLILVGLAFWLLTLPITTIGLLIAAAAVLIVLLVARWEELSTTVKQIIFIMVYYINQFKEQLKDAFFSALDSIKNKFETIFTGIKNFVKSAINNIIDYINSMIQNVVDGLNGIISGLNSVGSVVPGFQALATVSAPQIPRLATGAVIPPNSEFLAVLGDQRSGTNIEAPADLIRQILRDELGRGGNGGGEITIKFDGSLSALVRELKPYIDKENSRVGASLIRSGI